MKHVTLKSLTLSNWRGGNRTTEFNPAETTIAGGNGLGKSRHFDAFMWLLFGKDRQDRKDFNVKTVVNGKPLEKTDSSVTVLLEVNGEEVKLQRILIEEWVKPRGQVEQVFKGNKTECYWNDVPINVTEFQKRVNDIVSDTIFKMVTNPMFFANMDWKTQRDVLFEIAGTISDTEIANTRKEFAELLDKLSGKSFTDFKRELSARKKRLKDDLAEIQPRIDQTQKLMPEMTDFATLEEEVARIEAEIEKVDKQLSDANEHLKAQSEIIQSRQTNINKLKEQRQQLVFDAQSKAKEEAFNANAKRRELELSIENQRRSTETQETFLRARQEEKARLQSELENLNVKTDKLREEWHSVNGSEYNGETTCKCCGQELPADKIKQAKDFFLIDKQAKLNKINEQGKYFKEEKEKVTQGIKSADFFIEAQEKEVASQTAELKTLAKQLANLPEITAKEVVLENIKEYNTLTAHIELHERTLYDNIEKPDTTELQAKRTKLINQLSNLKARLKDKDTIEQYNKVIANLEKESKFLAQQIADAEREEYIMNQFTKTKIDECEKRINNLFTMVTFKLFDKTIEGNDVEVCVPLVNGVPFAVANTADQMNGGLDIINTLCKFYGVCAPIFIDNRESVNELVETESQIINLVVNHDNFLTIK